MKESLEKEAVIAVKSIDFFEKSFTDNKKSLLQLNEIENIFLFTKHRFSLLIVSRTYRKIQKVALRILSVHKQ